MSDLVVIMSVTAAAVAAVALGIYVVHRVSRVRIHPERRVDEPISAPGLSVRDNFREPWPSDREQ